MVKNDHQVFYLIVKSEKMGKYLLFFRDTNEFRS